MNQRTGYFYLLSLALWWGSLTTIGFVVIPLLFQHLPNKQVAGQLAAQMFSHQAYVSWACCALLLVTLGKKKQSNIHNNQLLIFLGVVFSLLVYFIVAPQIALRQNLKLWHSLGTAFFGGQWLCASVLLYRHGHYLGNNLTTSPDSPINSKKEEKSFTKPEV
jgi:general stress protein CsbA